MAIKEMKLTKATVKRLNAHSDINKPGYIEAIHAIADILNRSAVILGDSGNYEINDGSFVEAVIYSDGAREYVSGTTQGEYQKCVIRGLSTRYPSLISGTFTHGLNGVAIYEVNKLVRAILEN